MFLLVSLPSTSVTADFTEYPGIANTQNFTTGPWAFVTAPTGLVTKRHQGETWDAYFILNYTFIESNTSSSYGSDHIATLTVDTNPPVGELSDTTGWIHLGPNTSTSGSLTVIWEDYAINTYWEVAVSAACIDTASSKEASHAVNYTVRVIF